MAELKLTEVQQELLENAQRELQQIQTQYNVVLTATLAGINVRKAANVRQEGDMLTWDDPGDDGGDETPAGPQPVVDKEIVDRVAEQILADAPKTDGEPSETAGPALHEGDSEGPEASVPDEGEKVSEESEPASEEESATVH